MTTTAAPSFTKDAASTVINVHDGYYVVEQISDHSNGGRDYGHYEHDIVGVFTSLQRAKACAETLAKQRGCLIVSSKSEHNLITWNNCNGLLDAINVYMMEFDSDIDTTL